MNLQTGLSVRSEARNSEPASAQALELAVSITQMVKITIF